MAKESLNWTDEKTAADALGYTIQSLRIYTRSAKRKKLPIRTCKLSKKKILYSGSDIEKYKESKIA